MALVENPVPTLETEKRPVPGKCIFSAAACSKYFVISLLLVLGWNLSHGTNLLGCFAEKWLQLGGGQQQSQHDPVEIWWYQGRWCDAMFMCSFVLDWPHIFFLPFLPFQSWIWLQKAIHPELDYDLKKKWASKSKCGISEWKAIL
jgi:hypothetical protein